MANEKKDKVIVPFQIERDRKNRLLAHCKMQDMSLSQLIRQLLREYEEREKIGG